MPTINYSIKYRKNEGLVFSPEELLALYFYGIQIQSTTGNNISNNVIRQQILSAQQEVEKFLEIRLFPRLITDNLSFYRDDYWNRFPILRVKLPVTRPLSLTGRLNRIDQINYPEEWLNAKNETHGRKAKQISIVPTGSAATRSSIDVLLTGYTAYLGVTSFENIPFYFDVQYVSGFKASELPYDIMELIGKLAAIKLFHIAGDLILGAGIASVSLGIDGLSQTINTTSSATNSGYGARILGYLKDIDASFNRLKYYYKGFNISAL